MVLNKSAVQQRACCAHLPRYSLNTSILFIKNERYKLRRFKETDITIGRITISLSGLQPLKHEQAPLYQTNRIGYIGSAAIALCGAGQQYFLSRGADTGGTT